MVIMVRATARLILPGVAAKPGAIRKRISHGIASSAITVRASVAAASVAMASAASTSATSSPSCSSERA
jgi:hypothetical protein